MAKFYSITCPSCGKHVEEMVHDDRENMVCPHCGEEINFFCGGLIENPDDYVMFID